MISKGIHRSVNRIVGRKGRGLMNTLINKLPFEVHIPGYSYCGPGTKLKKRLERGDKGVNLLDEACKEHDIAYSDSNSLSDRHVADEKLYRKAVERVKSRDTRFGERLAASAVALAMKGKTKLGMGVKGVHRKLVKVKRARKLRTRKRRARVGGAISFVEAMRKARNAIRRIGKNKGIFKNARIAYHSLKKSGRKGILSPRARIIAIPKRGGFLPLIPLFAALSAIGSLGGGAAAIAKAVNAAKAARDQLKESKRHNAVMESEAKSGSGISIGHGLYIKPYKSGCGVDISNSGTASKNL